VDSVEEKIESYISGEHWGFDVRPEGPFRLILTWPQVIKSNAEPVAPLLALDTPWS
jgi:hypothetical protein